MIKRANPNDEKFWKNSTQFREVIIFVPKETS
ncbi:Uncharacterised protein [Escherichia coli]|uniref:Uncharacterized protein n=1 Tax=Escherichia coli TaxID=562 RepID=A0A377CUL2_ECOLX|nr:Uncharacterised protein [Escherichia coli]